MWNDRQCHFLFQDDPEDRYDGDGQYDTDMRGCGARGVGDDGDGCLWSEQWVCVTDHS